MTIDTGIGPATVLHRLAIGVECLDVLTGGLIQSSVRVGWEAHPRQLSRRRALDWPCLPFDADGPARHKLRYDRPLPTRTPMIVRVDDPSRRYVPRRFHVRPWLIAELDATAVQPYVPVNSRLLRPWLLPAAAYPLPGGTTSIRGRVMYPDSTPVRWARIEATGPVGGLAGRARADERGEFLLAITDAGQNPLLSTVPVSVTVRGTRPAAFDPDDRCADLVIEDIQRSAVPPAAIDLDNPVLRDIAVPTGYRPNIRAATLLTVTTGAELRPTVQIVFDPQP